VFEVAPNAAGEKDHLILAVGNDSQYAKFCAVAGVPELASNPLFAKNSNRVLNRAQLVPTHLPILCTSEYYPRN
jgi:crotonobetainyl-CoA:carnitine CoA-transferase CaiB-like acyl-CoA transferase